MRFDEQLRRNVSVGMPCSWLVFDMRRPGKWEEPGTLFPKGSTTPIIVENLTPPGMTGMKVRFTLPGGEVREGSIGWDDRATFMRRHGKPGDADLLQLCWDASVMVRLGLSEAESRGPEVIDVTTAVR